MCEVLKLFLIGIATLFKTGEGSIDIRLTLIVLKVLKSV